MRPFEGIERWRASLASNILERNTLTQRELNAAVQLTIDRVIFSGYARPWNRALRTPVEGI
jgi:hypothetical protein